MPITLHVKIRVGITQVLVQPVLVSLQVLYLLLQLPDPVLCVVDVLTGCLALSIKGFADLNVSL
jgi:hypothetical protein